MSRRRTPAPGRARWPHGDQLSGDTSGGHEPLGPQTSTGCDPATMRRHHGRSSVHDSPPDSRGSDSGGPSRNAGASPSWPRTSHCHALPTAPLYARCRSLPCPRRSVRYRDSRRLRGSRQSVLQSTAGRNTPMPGRDCSVTLGPREAHATSAPAPAHTVRARPGRRRRRTGWRASCGSLGSRRCDVGPHPTAGWQAVQCEESRLTRVLGVPLASEALSLGGHAFGNGISGLDYFAAHFNGRPASRTSGSDRWVPPTVSRLHHTPRVFHCLPSALRTRELTPPSANLRNFETKNLKIIAHAINVWQPPPDPMDIRWRIRRSQKTTP